jgi:ATP-dependent helicase IRC3
LGGKDEIDNLQTLCVSCKSEKGVERINFRKSKTDFTACPIWFRQLRIPNQSSNQDSAEWEKFLCRSVNFFYQCGAVKKVWADKPRKNTFGWRVKLEEGNDCRWLEKYVKGCLERMQNVGDVKQCGFPRSLIIEGPEDRVIVGP